METVNQQIVTLMLSRLYEQSNFKAGTCYICAVGIHGEFGGVHQSAADSCRCVKNVAALTWDEDDGVVYYHAARRKPTDFHSHPL